MALVRDGIITSSKKPGQMRIKKSKKQFIPEVMYKEIDQYKNEITKKADPYFPAEFFLIQVLFIHDIFTLIFLGKTWNS